VSFNPALIADTSARLSFLLRPRTEGTVIAGGLAESLGSTEAESGRRAESPAVTATGCMVGNGDCSTPTAGSASVLAQAARSARTTAQAADERMVCMR